MIKPLSKELKIALLKAVQAGAIDSGLLTELKALFGENQIEIRVVNSRKDLEFFDKYEKWLKENGGESEQI